MQTPSWEIRNNIFQPISTKLKTQGTSKANIICPYEKYDWIILIVADTSLVSFFVHISSSGLHVVGP